MRGKIHIMEKTLNQVTLKFDSRSINENFARATAAAFISQLDPTLDELNDMKTAVSEAVTNSIVHAYPNSVGDITMTVKIQEHNTVEILVRDKGLGIPDINQAREPMYTTGGFERSGMGFTIMENFMDKLKIKSVPGRGTSIKMSKQLAMRVSSGKMA